ncbi:DUF742 domain-containing protein, partial [Streptomyces sp. PSKA30]|uniref:DUF742 domain-containing protein n=1 Tax=Streptomyces sp. PSKA30 TaxID=2874597 RepID=UPI001CD0A9D5
MNQNDGASDYTASLGGPFAQGGPSRSERGGDQAVGGWRLRPFLLTEGRARAVDDSIGLETQVVATERGLQERQSLRFERRDIVELCMVPLSVAEISARLSLHYGVVRVLVADLATEGLLHVHVVDADAARNVHTI